MSFNVLKFFFERIITSMQWTVYVCRAQLTEALAADTVTTLVHGLRSAILRTNSASSSASRGYSRDHQSRGQRAGAVSDDVSHIAPQCKALQTTLPHGRTLASSLKQVYYSA